MSPFAYSNLTTSRDLTYGYIHIPPSQPQKQYLLFLHGFPSGSHDWRYQIAYFFAKGYGIIAPDCLGYGQSAKPLNTALYNGKGMAADIHDILKHEGIESVIGVAHDWYAFLSQSGKKKMEREKQLMRNGA
jgi:soluble epoxide hydrolase/lipid-phosphate phosphatase